MSDVPEKKTALYDEHVRRGAKIIPFGGWLMPVHYTGIVHEHQAVRTHVGMFDISHMGQFAVSGSGSAAWLNQMLTNNIEKLAVNQGQYTFLLNANGGIIDDLIAYRIGSDDFLLVVNAARIDEDFSWLDHERPQGVSMANRSDRHGAVAIQGPEVMALFQDLLGETGALPPRNQIVDTVIEEMPVTIARTGYTGEDGVEVFFQATDAARLWNVFLERGQKSGLKPCGLGARDTLRLEMCYPLNGSDLSPSRNPIEAGLGFFVDLTKAQFTGRDVVFEAKQNGTPQKLAAFRMESKGPPPRSHYAVFSDNAQVGEVTSGTLSPSLNYGIGMAYIDTPRARIGSKIEIEIRGQRFPAVIEKKPLYKKNT
jgi:aminomethyltransferase